MLAMLVDSTKCRSMSLPGSSSRASFALLPETMKSATSDRAATQQNVLRSNSMLIAREWDCGAHDDETNSSTRPSVEVVRARSGEFAVRQRLDLLRLHDLRAVPRRQDALDDEIRLLRDAQ